MILIENLIAETEFYLYKLNLNHLYFEPTNLAEEINKK